jgi:hypothetical protein
VSSLPSIGPPSAAREQSERGESYKSIDRESQPKQTRRWFWRRCNGSRYPRLCTSHVLLRYDWHYTFVKVGAVKSFRILFAYVRNRFTYSEGQVTDLVYQILTLCHRLRLESPYRNWQFLLIHSIMRRLHRFPGCDTRSEFQARRCIAENFGYPFVLYGSISRRIAVRW